MRLKINICSYDLKFAFSYTKYCLKQNLLNQQDLVMSNLEKIFTILVVEKLEVNYED